MGRRTSGGSVGLEKIGNVQANLATLTTTQANSDLVLDPNGTGNVQVNGSITVNSGDVTIADQGDLRLREAVANGSNYIAMQAAANMASNYTITWPSAVAGVSGYVLSSDTSGNLSWSAAGGTIPVSDPGAVATVYYPLFGTNAGAVPTTLSPNARSNLSFVPSSGELISTIQTAATQRGSNGAGGTLTLQGTGNATKATASILMNENVASTSTTTGTLVVTGGVGIGGKLFTGTDIDVNGVVIALRTEVAQTTSYTLQLTDRGKTVSFTPGAAINVTIPQDTTVNFPVGSIVYINNVGSGSTNTLTLQKEAAVTATNIGQRIAPGEEIELRKRAANYWIVIQSPTSVTASTVSSPSATIATAGGFRTHTWTSGTDTFTVS